MNQLLFHQQDRSQGKRARTRAKLMDAAVNVIAQKGVQAASINEITVHAEVANGTFYNHFADKNELVSAMAFRIAGDIAKQIDLAMKDITDAAQRVSFGTRQFVELATAYPNWGWALVQSIDHLPNLRESVVYHIRQDISLGVASGRFNVAVNEFLIDVVISMIGGTIRAKLLGHAGENAASTVAEYQLRVLGVDHKTAAQTAYLPLATLALSQKIP